MSRFVRASKGAWSAMSASARRVTVFAVVALVAFVAYQPLADFKARKAEEDRVAAQRALADRAEERKLVEQARRAALTPQQREAEDAEKARAHADREAKAAKIQAERDAEKARKELDEKNQKARYVLAVTATGAVKQSLRNPDSVRWDSVLINEDGTVACINYGAQNGFGGMNREFIVVTKNKAMQTEGAWNKHCANKPLHDLKYAAR